MVNIRKITSVEDYNEFIKKSDSVNIVKFYADWCGPCKVLTDKIVNLNPDKLNNVFFGEVNVDNEDFDSVCSELGIRGIPVLAYFKNGVLVNKSVGLVNDNDIYTAIEKC